MSKKDKQTLGSKISKGQKALPKSFRKEWLKRRMKGYLKWLKNSSDEEKKKLYRNKSIEMKEWWDSIPEGKRAKFVRSRNYWKDLSEAEKRKRLSKSILRPDVRKKNAIARKGWWNRLSNVQKKAFIAICNDPEVRKKAVKGYKKWWNGLSDTEKLAFGRKSKERWGKLSKKRKKLAARRLSRSIKRWWASLNERERTEFLRHSSFGRTPSPGEKLISKLLRPYRRIEYTGNGTFWITCKDGTCVNPDFVVRPFRKTRKVIEYFGFTGHKPKTLEKLKKYRGRNVRCLAIYTENFKNPGNLLKRVVKFLG